ncbi:hypothetical protein P170DRAFT_426589 [Aspergillus steynii IBT 23096]|uniref:Uncharacterized protein n=1 Tax=Aspergillus steynii IBT 23096 TaxID=1392250 RepID=A0A2I2GA16_9EURO|nr:uncharacterized protein P170DRAFT_426589 [Aspergillus steynii IBT 23096]PLB49720.1 hypothetical protein P170DRAFT_426589 [Aspergillus steynii IBT 23096]
MSANRSLKVGNVTGDGGRATGYQAIRLGPASYQQPSGSGGASGGDGAEISFATSGQYHNVEAGDISSNGGDAQLQGRNSYSRTGIVTSGKAAAGGAGKITIG